jgi:hypothetical protein
LNLFAIVGTHEHSPMKKLLLVLPLLFAALLRGAPAGLSSIPFSTSQAQFASGDSITIQEVLASSPRLEVGDFVVVRGQYRLGSRESASLQIQLTTSTAGPSGSLPTSRLNVNAGSGAFELEYQILQVGSLHVTFYPATGGASFGGIYFAPGSSPSGPTNPTGPTTPVTPPPPISTSGLVEVPFSTSRVQFAVGDGITIRQVLASSPRMEPGDRVVARGDYRLGSRDSALLLFTLTQNAPGATERVAPTSRMTVNAGAGTFELEYTIQQPGSLHVSFYPAESGSVFGGIYFAPPGTASETGGGLAINNPTTNTGRLANLSTRGLVGPGDGSLVTGLVVSEQDRYVLIRGVGPTLSAFGVSGTLRKPVISVYKSNGDLVATAGSWSTSFTADQRSGIEMLTRSVGGFPLAAGSDDAVLHLRLVPGSYTVVIAAGDGQPGVGLMEIYASSTFTLPTAR